MTDGLDRPVYFSVARYPRGKPSVMQGPVTLTLTFGDGDDHEHAEIRFADSEAVALAFALIEGAVS